MRSPPYFTTGQPLPTENPADVLSPIWTQSCIPEVIFEPPSPACSLASDLSPSRILIIAVEPRLSDVLFEFLDGTNTWGHIHEGTEVIQLCSI